MSKKTPRKEAPSGASRKKKPSEEPSGVSSEEPSGVSSGASIGALSGALSGSSSSGALSGASSSGASSEKASSGASSGASSKTAPRKKKPSIASATAGPMEWPPSVLKYNYKYIYRELSPSFTKGRANDRGVTGCGISLLFYIVISLLWSKFPDDTFLPEGEMNHYLLSEIEKLSGIVKSCERDIKIYNFIGENSLDEQIDRGGHKLTYGIETLLLHAEGNQYNIFPMALTFKHVNPPNRPVINHFFAVIQRGYQYSILSSYGCDSLSASQTEIPLVVEEFVKFIIALNAQIRPEPPGLEDDKYTEDDFDVISKFFKKYFFELTTLKDKVYNVETINNRKQHANYTSTKGIELELQFYKKRVFQCWFCPDFFDDVKRVVDSFGPPASVVVEDAKEEGVDATEGKEEKEEKGGGKRKNKTKKRKKSKKTKKRKKVKKGRRSKMTKTSRRSRRT